MYALLQQKTYNVDTTEVQESGRVQDSERKEDKNSEEKEDKEDKDPEKKEAKDFENNIGQLQV